MRHYRYSKLYHCNYKSYIDSDPILYSPEDNDNIHNTIWSINMDLPLTLSDNAMDDISTQNEYVINYFSFSEDPNWALFDDTNPNCISCQKHTTDTPIDGKIDSVAPIQPSLNVSAQIDSSANTNTTTVIKLPFYGIFIALTIRNVWQMLVKMSI